LIDEIAGERSDIKAVKIHADEEQELAAAFQIMRIPTFAVIRNGSISRQSAGAIFKNQNFNML
jgi:thioredoxin 1